MGRYSAKIINREISWLQFNDRVLQEAADIRTPLIERLKFLGIFSNNLDEFFRVRVATIKRLISLKNKNSDQYIGFNPTKTLKEINKIVIGQQQKFNDIYKSILSKLEKENIFIINEKQLSKEQGEFVLNYFQNEVRPNIFPVMFKQISKSFTLKDNYIYLITELIKEENKVILKQAYDIIEVPSDKLPRFIILPQIENKRYIIILEDIIRYCLNDIFGLFDYNQFKAYTIKITRDAEIDLDNDVSKSFMELMSESIKQRKMGIPVRLIYDNNMPAQLLKFLTVKFKIKKTDTVISGERYHNFKDFMKFPDLGLKKLNYEKINPLLHKDIPHGISILNVLKEKDILLHYPYNSFHYVIDLLREASIDPKVKSIKMVLYRVAKTSNIVSALINAARNGKSVTVFLELQARFDEEANIYWAGKLQEEGVKIIPTIPGLKVHCKLILIKKIENNKPVLYGNISTGNYNEETSKTFSDIGLFTSNKNITSEIEKVFYMCEASYKPTKFKHLIVSPISMRKHFIHLLKNEIKNAKAGIEAYVLIKLNSMVDGDIIKKLYQASNEGVKIKLIIRGICTLIPGIKGLSDHIEGVSIVDRYLEHARVMIFCNGGDEKYYISSADWMTRNFDHRIEVATPIYDKNIQKYLKEMMILELNDTVKARVINDNDKNEYKKKKNIKEHIQSQTEIYNLIKQHFC